MDNSQTMRELPPCLQPAKEGLPCNEPLDSRDLATRLETEGVTDAVARSRFGFPDTWAMAEAWLPRVLAFPRPVATPLPRRKGWRDYWKGISFALPLATSCISILVFGFALWGGDLTIEEATAVGLGTIFSFLITGGFVQAMARQGLFFSGTKQFRRCERATWWWLRAAGGALVAGTAGLLLVSVYWELLPGRLNLVAAGFCLVLGVFWMATGILHFLDGGILILTVTTGGILLVAGLHLVLRMPLIASQLVAITVSAGIAGLLAGRRLRARREKTYADGSPVRALDVLVLWPYFVYGLFYYVLLFSDRMIAWTANTHATALVVQFRGEYENAINLGLLAFVLQVGWVQYSATQFYRVLSTAEREIGINEVGLLRALMVRFYWKRIARFVPFAIAASLIPAALLVGPLDHVDRWTAVWSIAGFPLLVVGLWNASLLFGLSGAVQAAAAAGAAMVVDVVAGYVASRLGSPHDAVIGFVLGALTFAVLSGRWSLEALRAVDHRYYAASQ